MENKKMNKKEVLERLEALNPRSAWDKGVRSYAVHLLEIVDNNYIIYKSFDKLKELEKIMLNGAKDWKHYSWSGNALIYDGDIAKTLCTESEFLRSNNGQKRPNKSEQWLDTQARALFQAFELIKRVINA